MKSFEDLSRLGQIRRMRQLGQAALNGYGMADARLTFIRQAGNTLFRVNEGKTKQTGKQDVYATGQYMLRIHQPGYQAKEGIELELAWLASMCHEAGLPVPEPIPALDGSLLTRVSVPGIPGERNCSLLRWVKGRRIKPEQARPYHYKAQGQLMARMHQHTAGWQVPAGLTKRKYNWEGLFREDSGTGIPASEAWSLLPRDYVAAYEQVTLKVKQVMDDWGRSPQLYGLIHADLGMDANLLFLGQEARAIDFDDSGFGYYPYDLSMALEHLQEDESLPIIREALLEGYTQIRTLSDEQVKTMDLFLAAFCVFLSLWAATSIPTQNIKKSFPKEWRGFSGWLIS